MATKTILIVVIVLLVIAVVVTNLPSSFNCTKWCKSEGGRSFCCEGILITDEIKPGVAGLKYPKPKPGRPESIIL